MDQRTETSTILHEYTSAETFPARLVPIDCGPVDNLPSSFWPLFEPVVPDGTMIVYRYRVQCGYPRCSRVFGHFEWTNSTASPYWLRLDYHFVPDRDDQMVWRFRAEQGPRVLLRETPFSPRVEWEREHARFRWTPYLVGGGMRSPAPVERDANGKIVPPPRLKLEYELPIIIICDRIKLGVHCTEVIAPALPTG